MSRVERKRRLARQRLVDAALELIAEGGVEGLRLREITARADVGFGSFYSHFATKEELVEAVVADSVGSLTEAIIEYATEVDDPAEQAAIAHRHFVRLAYEDPQLAWLIVHLDRADVLLEQASIPHLRPVLERGMASGRFTGGDIDLLISFVVGATIAVMRSILNGGLGADADAESARTLLRMFGVADAEAAEIAGRPQSSRRSSRL